MASRSSAMALGAVAVVSWSSAVALAEALGLASWSSTIALVTRARRADEL